MFKILTRLTVALLFLGIVISVISTMFLLPHYLTLLQIENKDPTSFQYALFIMDRNLWHIGVRNIQGVLSIIMGISFLLWLCCANYNAKEVLGAKDMRFSPFGAMMWFFAPILCLWKPYQAIKEVWMASDTIDWKIVNNTTILNYFWFLWITSLIFIPLGFHFYYITHVMKYPLLITGLQIIFDLINVALFSLLIVIMRRIYSMQIKKAQYDQLI